MENLDIAKTPQESLGDCDAIDVYFFKNGQQDAPPRKYHLTQSDLSFWNETLKSVAELQNETDLLFDPLELYKLNGEKIEGPLELRDGAAYVVVHSNEHFTDSGYASYMVQASRSLGKRLKQIHYNSPATPATLATPAATPTTLSTVPTIKKAGKKNKKIKLQSNNILQPEHRKAKETKNITQISNMEHKPAWPGKRKENGNVQKITRPLSPIRRKGSPTKKTKFHKQESSTTNPSKTESNKEMVSLTKRDNTPEGVQNCESNIGQLADVFRDMDIKKNLENDNARLLILLNEKKIIPQVDVGMQVLVINMDDSTDPLINLVEFDDKGIQKPSTTSVYHHYAKDNYVALMQPDGSIQLTIKISSSGDGVTTDITDKNNVEMIKLDDKANDDKMAELSLDTSLADKVIIDTKIVKVIAIRCVSNDSKHACETSSTAENYITRLIKNEELENNQIQIQHQEICEQEIISQKSSKNTITDTIIYARNSDAVEKYIENQYTENQLIKVLNEDKNEIDGKTADPTELLDNNAKPIRRVSMCIDGKEDCDSELADKRKGIDEDGEDITLLETGKKIMDFTSRKLSVTIENAMHQQSNEVGETVSLPQHQIKSCNVTNTQNDSSVSKTLPDENITPSLRKETNTPNRSQATNTSKKRNIHPSSPKTKNSRFDYKNTYSGVERNCDFCSHHPPPYPPQCTPTANVSAMMSDANVEYCVCPGTMDKYCQYIQTDSCEVLLMVRRNLEDSQFCFHFPTIKDLKDYKLI